MRKLWPSFAALGTAALTIFTPTIQGAISAHPAVSASLAAAYAILAHILQSPFDGPQIPPASK